MKLERSALIADTEKGHVLIREATPADAAAIARVHYDTWQAAFRGIVPDAYLASTSYEKRKSAWESALSRNDGTKLVCVAEDESGQIVGFAVGGPERTRDAEFKGELEAIYILPAHQRQGIGQRLVGWIAERLIRSNLTPILVWTLADSPSRRFYEALGGHQVRESMRDFGGTPLKLVAFGWRDDSVLVNPSCREDP